MIRIHRKYWYFTWFYNKIFGKKASALTNFPKIFDSKIFHRRCIKSLLVNVKIEPIVHKLGQWHLLNIYHSASTLHNVPPPPCINYKPTHRSPGIETTSLKMRIGHIRLQQEMQRLQQPQQQKQHLFRRPYQIGCTSLWMATVGLRDVKISDVVPTCCAFVSTTPRSAY